MSSEMMVGYKRSASDAPDNSDDDGSQPGRGKEAEVAGPRLGEAEDEKAEEGWQCSQCAARGAQDDGHHAADRKSSQAGHCLTQFEVSCAEREAGRGARSLKTRERKSPSTSKKKRL